MRYSIEPRDRRYVKGYGFLSFAEKIDKIIVIKLLQKEQFKKQQKQQEI